MLKRYPQILFALLALLLCTGTVQAASLSANVSSVALNCFTGSGASNTVTVTISKAASGTIATYPSSAITVAAPQNSGIVVTPPQTNTLASSSSTIQFSFSLPQGCTGVSATEGAPYTLQFKLGTNNDITLPVTTWQNAQLGTTLAVYPVPLVLGCNTATGPAQAQTVTVKPLSVLSGNSTIGVSLVVPAVVTASPAGGTQTLNAASNIAQSYSFAYNTCANISSSTTQSIQFKNGANVDLTLTATSNVVATASGLVLSPSALTVYCGKTAGGPNVVGSPQTVWVSYAPAGGMAFTVNSSPALPNWLSVSSGFTAISTPLPLVFTPTGCGGLTTVGSTTSSIVNLQDASTPGKNITVTLKLLDVSPLTASVVGGGPASLTYVKNSGAPGHLDVNVTASSTTFFAVDTASMPTWLSVDSASASTPKAIRFSSTSYADTLAPGTYNGTVHLKVATFGDLLFPISLLITNSAPKLQITNLSSVPPGTPFVQGANTLTSNWSVGSALPTMAITAQSTDSPISYSIATSGTLFPSGTHPIPSNLIDGLAYSFGTVIPVTPDPGPFAAAQPGDTLTGNVTFTWGSPAATTVVTFNVKVMATSATLAAISPASEPTTAGGTTYNVVLTGTGFIGGDNTTRTRVGVVSSNVLGANIVFDNNLQITSVTPTAVFLTINVPSVADANLPFSSAGTIYLAVCNPGVCPIATGVVALSVGTTPTIQSVTSASSFQQVTGSNLQTVAPYDMISIFGSNFCTSCTSGQILQGRPDVITAQYPLQLSPDSTNNVSVVFQTTGQSPSPLGTAPLLFATNNQINLLVPGGLSDGNVDLVVSYGSGSSQPYHLTVVDANPGIFTIGADGQGAGAILNTNYALVSQSAPAGMRKTSSSDTVAIYMTGLGVPDSLASNASVGNGPSAAWSTDCVAPMPPASNSFMASLNTQITNAGGSALTSLDGVVLPSSLLAGNRLMPCFLAADTQGGTPTISVTIGGQPAQITYAGWIDDSIAGLYQIDVTLPNNTNSGAGNFTTASGSTLTTIADKTQLPVVVHSHTKNSQAGVYLWVAPRLTVTAPTALSGMINQSWSASNNTLSAADGTASYHYAVTTGLLPSGLSLDPNSGAITGTPVAIGSFPVTVTATDSATPAVTGTASFTLTVGLNLSLFGGPTFNPTYSAVGTTVTSITATGGASPYVFTIAAGPAGMAAISTGANTADIKFSSTALTPAGTYTGARSVVVQATDANGVVNTINLPMTLALKVVATGASATVTQSSGGAVTTGATTTGMTGGVTYTLDDGAGNTAGFSIDANSGAITLAASNTASTITYHLTVTATDAGTAPVAVANSHATGTVIVNVQVQ